MEASIVPLKDLCQNYKDDIVDGPFGANLKRQHYQTEGVPVLKIQNIEAFGITLKKMDYVTTEKYEELRRHSYQPGDIIMTKLGDPLGESAIVDDIDNGLIVADLVRIRAQKIDTRYLCYHLNSPVTSSYINAQQKGTTRPRVRISVVRDLPIFVPPIAEQKRIVAILDQAFVDIEKARALTEQNLKNACELFESYLHQVFSQRGEGWSEAKLQDFCEQITVGHVGSMASKYKTAGIPFLRSQNVRPFRVSMVGMQWIDEDFNAELKKSQLSPGDVAIVRTGYPGTAAVIPESLPLANCSDLVIARTKPSLSPHFLELFLNSSFGKALVGANLVGAAQKHFNVTAAKNVLFAAPAIGEQDRIVEEASSFRRQITEVERLYDQKIIALEELKKSILQKAFSGELTKEVTEAAA